MRGLVDILVPWLNIYRVINLIIFPSRFASENKLLAARKRLEEKGFRFKKAWLYDEECRNIVEETWMMIEGDDAKEKIMACAGSLGSWSCERRIDFIKEVTKRRKRIRESM